MIYKFSSLHIDNIYALSMTVAMNGYANGIQHVQWLYVGMEQEHSMFSGHVEVCHQSFKRVFIGHIELWYQNTVVFW